MIIKFKNLILRLFSCTIAIVLYSNTIFAANILYSYEEEELAPGPIVIPYSEMVVTGDSYAGLFCTFEDNRDFRLIGYAVAGKTIEENREIMYQAMADSERKLGVICIGVNDQYHNTPPYRFEYNLRNILNVALINKKYIFISSYVNYPASIFYTGSYTTSIYDNIIRKLAQEYPYVYYVDMTDCANEELIASDNIHYGKEFYDIMYNRIIDIIRTIDF